MRRLSRDDAAGGGRWMVHPLLIDLFRYCNQFVALFAPNHFATTDQLSARTDTNEYHKQTLGNSGTVISNCRSLAIF